MNNGGTVPPCRRRKQVLQLVKAIEFYMKQEDGHEEIDSTLDKALDCLGEVANVMNGYWRRAVAEREAMKKRFADEEALLVEARKTATKVTPELMQSLRQKQRIREYLQSLAPEARDAFLFAAATSDE